MASASAVIASQNCFSSGLIAIKAPRFRFRPPKKYSSTSSFQSVSPAPQRYQPPLPSTPTLNLGVLGDNEAGRGRMGRLAGGPGTRVPILRARGGGTRQVAQLSHGQAGPSIFRQPVWWNTQRRLPRPGDAGGSEHGNIILAPTRTVASLKAGAKQLWAKRLWKNTRMT